ncbi:MAG: Rpn family recombination-promoting nuclease/putative transposase [Planctomycetota bacterium]
MPLGIRPTNDFAFKKTFGTAENRVALISLLNAILDPALPIIEVTLQNPYNLQDYEDDKLSILDVKAVDQSGAIYDIEMQLTIFEGLVQRIVFYGCELYAGQLKEGDDYTKAHPVFSICLVDGILWKDATKVHHAFRLTDAESGRVLQETLEIHTLELGRYNLREADLKTASMLDCWLFWFLHAHEYEADALLKLFPQQAIRQATQTIVNIAQVTEDKVMYDAREKAIRDQQWAMNAAHREGVIEGELKGKIEGEIEGKIKGEIKGEIKLIRTLQAILCIPVSEEQELRALNLAQLESLTNNLQSQSRNRTSSQE